MSIENKWMVYLHVDKETHEVFYVGLGVLKRPWCMIRRNPIWKKYVAKYGKPKVVIIQKFPSREAAAELEKKLISKYGRKKDGGSLCNILLEDCNPMSDPEVKKKWLETMRSERMNDIRRKTYKDNKTKIIAGLHSEESRAKAKASMSTPEFKKKRSGISKKTMNSPDQRNRLGDWKRGRKVTNKTKKLMSEKAKAREFPIEAREAYRKLLDTGYNPMQSASARKKLSKSLKGIKRSEEHKVKNGIAHSKPIKQFDLDMNFIKEFPNIRSAAKEVNCTPANIGMCCNNKTKTAKGFIWEFSFVGGYAGIARCTADAKKICNM